MENRYKILRKEFNLTQIELAKRVNVEQSAISKWELNKTIPDYLTLQKLAEIYNTTTDYLLGLTDQREIPKTNKLTQSIVESILLDDELTANKIKEFTPEQTAAAKSYLKFLSDKNDKKK